MVPASDGLLAHVFCGFKAMFTCDEGIGRGLLFEPSIPSIGCDMARLPCIPHHPGVWYSSIWGITMELGGGDGSI